MLVYVHFPFCKSKCAYCDFNSFAGADRATIFAYLAALKREMRLASEYLTPSDCETLYIGGGTPSMLPAEAVAEVVETARRYLPGNYSEITVECNPESVDESKPEIYRDCGVNRVSLGVQSLDDNNLSSVGRLHNGKIALEKIALLRRFFENVSADVIVGLPYDTLSIVASEIDELAAAVSHMSVYELSLEEGTPLAERAARGEVALPGDDETAGFFDEAASRLAAHGFERYEVSNFARPGYRSRHNSGYWTREPYLGFGAGAHSLIGDFPGKKDRAELRFASMRDVHGYIASVNCASDYSSVAREEISVISPDEALRERIMLGLRTSDGVPAALLEGIIPERLSVFFENTGENLRLSSKGLAVMNSILAEII